VQSRELSESSSAASSSSRRSARRTGATGDCPGTPHHSGTDTGLYTVLASASARRERPARRSGRVGRRPRGRTGRRVDSVTLRLTASLHCIASRRFALHSRAALLAY
jgi:hypothetical protein